MPRAARSFEDNSFLVAALEGLEMQRKRIDEQIQYVRALLGGRRGRPPALPGSAFGTPARKRNLSEAARRRIALAQKRRWAEYRKKAEKKES
jgi:hypothetical protein